MRAVAHDWGVHGEEAIQRVRSHSAGKRRNPVAYFKGILSLVQKDVSLESHISQALLYTQPLSATIAFLESIASEGDDSQVNEDDGESPAEILANNNPETSV